MRFSHDETGVLALPITHDLKLVFKLSYIVATLLTFLSAVGLLLPSSVYPTDALLQSCLPNDVINLIIGLPMLLGSMWLVRRGKLIGLLFWPGALMYILYNYIAYVFIIPSIGATIVAIILLALSIYVLLVLTTRIDGEAVQQCLTGVVSEKLSAGTLTVFGLAFIARAVDIVFKKITNQTTLPTTEWAILISDVLLSIAWIIGGISLWQRKAWGYVSGAGLLFVGSMLFVGLIVFLLLQPLLTSAPFVLSDVIVVFVMGIVCSIPFVLFARGVLSSNAS